MASRLHPVVLFLSIALPTPSTPPSCCSFSSRLGDEPSPHPMRCSDPWSETVATLIQSTPTFPLASRVPKLEILRPSVESPLRRAIYRTSALYSKSRSNVTRFDFLGATAISLGAIFWCLDSSGQLLLRPEGCGAGGTMAPSQLGQERFFGQ